MLSLSFIFRAETVEAVNAIIAPVEETTIEDFAPVDFAELDYSLDHASEEDDILAEFGFEEPEQPGKPGRIRTFPVSAQTPYGLQ